MQKVFFAMGQKYDRYNYRYLCVEEDHKYPYLGGILFFKKKTYFFCINRTLKYNIIKL